MPSKNVKLMNFVSSLIKTLKSSGNNGLLVYFSDHGEEVYDDPQHLLTGRNEAAPTAPMYTIPFLIWQSELWKDLSVQKKTQYIILIVLQILFLPG